MKSKEMKRWLPNKKNRPVVKSLSVPTEEDGGTIKFDLDHSFLKSAFSRSH
jgi:hypothetical protein